MGSYGLGVLHLSLMCICFLLSIFIFSYKTKFVVELGYTTYDLQEYNNNNTILIFNNTNNNNNNTINESSSSSLLVSSQSPPTTTTTTTTTIAIFHSWGLVKPIIGCAVFLLFTSCSHLIQGFLFITTPYTDLGSAPNWFRWIEYAITVPIMGAVIAESVGISDMLVITMMCFFRVIMIVCGAFTEWIADRILTDRELYRREHDKSALSSERENIAIIFVAQIVGGLCFLANWSAIVMQYYYSVFYNHDNDDHHHHHHQDVPVFVHILVAVMFVLEASFWVIQLMTLSDSSTNRRELLYACNSPLSKITLTLILFIGFISR
jgi:hypothetical protein